MTRRGDGMTWRQRADGTRVPRTQRGQGGAVYVLTDCPACGMLLAVDEDVEAFEPMTGARRVVPRLMLCGGCEFTLEF